ncbi:MAG: FdtA/QdtA family cupin domain-containing protein [Bacteroidota bacterium]|nr:FdtA/QdtA family cupin domain-containing protein [Bacteroidota bacterium]
MAEIINLNKYTDKRGNLIVIEKVLPFTIKRVFYIYGVDDSVRGNHRHKTTIQAAVSIQGSCRISNKSGIGNAIEEFSLDTPSKCLLINPEDYHWMDNFSKDCILMVFASEYFDKNDYIYENYHD